MTEVLLKDRKEGGVEIPVPEGRTTLGRGSDASHRLDDEGLSRLHASIFREGDRFWVVDENSTNGTFVNGEKVGPRGTVLKDGDEVSIGNSTELLVTVRRPEAEPKKEPSRPADTPRSADHSHLIMPLLVTMVALLVAAGAVLFIGAKMLSSADKEVVATEDEEDFGDDGSEPKGAKSPDASPTAGSSPTTVSDAPSAPASTSAEVQVPAGLFQNMTEPDKDKYVAARAEKIARIIGNQRSDSIPPAAVAEIKRYVKGYANRLKSAKKDSCEKGWGSSDFVSVLTRASRTSPMIIRHFRAEGVEPQVGIYIAMIEGEHCPCLTSPTGAQGMFQFLASSAPDYGLDPARRCEPEDSAKAGAKYLKSLIARFGTAPDSVPLAIASFNSGQGNLSNNLDKALAKAVGQDRSFWTLVANKEILEGRAGEQFRNENIAYVPKFFAAAIIGEHPADFGIPLQPLSTYAR